MFKYLIVCLISCFFLACKGPSSQEPATPAQKEQAETAVDSFAKAPNALNDQSLNVFVWEGPRSQARSFALKTNQAREIELQENLRIKVPAQAFVDQNGEVVEGNYDLVFRNLSEPWAMITSNIKMEYDSAGTHQLVSSLMFDIRAYQNGESLALAPGKEIDLQMDVQSPEAGFNWYRYDSLSGSWSYEAAAAPTKIKEPLTRSELTDMVSQVDVVYLDNDAPSALPVKPRLKDPTKQIVELQFDFPQLYPQFAPYGEDLKFEVNDTIDAQRLPNDWSNLSIELIDAKEGLYQLTLRTIRPKESVTLKIKPVFEAESFARAQDTYRRLRAKRERAAREAYERRIENLSEDQRFRERLVREWSLGGMGVFNCDRLLQQDFMELIPRFISEQGERLKIITLTQVIQGINSVFRYAKAKFRYRPDLPFMLLLNSADGRVFLLSYEESKRLRPPNAQNEIGIKVKEVDLDKVESFEKIKELALAP